MAKTSIMVPPFDKMIWPAIHALSENGGSASNQELLDLVVQIMGLSDDVQSVLHLDGPTTEVAYRLAWARTYMKKAGAIENSSRGVWRVPQANRTARARTRKRWEGWPKRPPSTRPRTPTARPRLITMWFTNASE